MPGDSLFSLLWVLICVAAIIALAYFAARYIGARGGFGAFRAGASQNMQVLARLDLGRDSMIVLVRAGERFFLLGVTASAISKLAEFTPQQAELWHQDPDQLPPSFIQVLRSAAQQRKQR